MHALKKAAEYPDVLFAGQRFWRLLLNEVNLYPKEERGKVVAFNLPSITVLKATKTIPPEEFKRVPSVLGVDFIDTHRFCLHFNPKIGEAFLLSDQI